MAQWSEAAIEERRKARLAGIIEERMGLFKKFRAAGWTINVVSPLLDREYKLLPDDYPKIDPHYLVKMPGAHPMRIKTIAQLCRLVRGAVA